MSNTKPVLLFVDEKNLKEAQLQLVKIQGELNEFISKSEKILGPISNEKKDLIKNMNFAYVESEVRKKFQFPKASDDFNLQSLGIDLTEVRKYQAANWMPYEFQLNDEGEFIANEQQEAFNSFYYYADTPKKIKALRLAEKLVDLSEEAANIEVDSRVFGRNGLFVGSYASQVSNAFQGIVSFDGDPRHVDCKLKVNKKGIALNMR